MIIRNILLIIVLVFISTKSFSNPLYLKCIKKNLNTEDYQTYFKILNNKEVFYRMESKWFKWCNTDFKILDDGFSCYSNDDGLENKLILDVFLKKLTTYHSHNNHSFKINYDCEIIE